MKVHEETWGVAMPACTLIRFEVIEDDGACSGAKGIAAPWRTLGGAFAKGDDVARMTFASAAPDMARVLLAVEWSGGDCAGTPVCPSCGADKYPANDAKPVHLADCALEASLRKAGVR